MSSQGAGRKARRRPVTPGKIQRSRRSPLGHPSSPDVRHLEAACLFTRPRDPFRPRDRGARLPTPETPNTTTRSKSGPSLPSSGCFGGWEGGEARGESRGAVPEPCRCPDSAASSASPARQSEPHVLEKGASSPELLLASRRFTSIAAHKVAHPGACLSQE